MSSRSVPDSDAAPATPVAASDTVSETGSAPEALAGPACRLICLVGMMGAGKTTVGKRLARRLGWSFVDADRELEARLGVSIPTIFDLEGEAGFRRRESEVIFDLAERQATVLATGGGAVISPDNRRVLREQGHVIYLRASAADLWHRLRRDTTRPLLRTPNPRARIETLVREREPMYQEVAHQVVDTGRQPVDRVVDTLLAQLPRKDSHASG
jgi:shikimate kinase